MRWVQVTKSCTLSTSLDLTKSNSKKYEPINIDYYIIYYPFYFFKNFHIYLYFLNVLTFISTKIPKNFYFHVFVSISFFFFFFFEFSYLDP